MKAVKLAALFLLVGTLFGCGSAKQYVKMPDLAKAIENPEKARIYVVRPQWYGKAKFMEVYDGDKLIALTKGETYVCWERDPGIVEIKSESENTDVLEIKVEKGKTYYIWQQVNMGFWSARTSLVQLSEAEGKEKLAKCRPVTVELK